MTNTDWIKMLHEWADEADSGEDVSLDGATLRELAGLIAVSALPTDTAQEEFSHLARDIFKSEMG